MPTCGTAAPMNTRTSHGICTAARSGAAFAAAHYDAWGYNDRNELTSSEQLLGTPENPGSAVPVNDRLYNYDPIGNRLDSATGEDDPVYYCANEPNQYDSIDDTTGGSPGWRFAWVTENPLIAAAPLAADGPEVVKPDSE